MKPTADFHDPSADARFPQAARVVDDAAALDAAVDGRDTHAAAGDPSMRRFRRARQGPAPRLPRRHDHLDLVERARQEAQILEPPTACGQGGGCRLCHAFLMDTAGLCVTQQEDHERRVEQPHVLHGMARFLTAITARLLSRILGALEAPFGAIMANRGEMGADVGTTAGGSVGVRRSAVCTTMAAASASATPRRWTSAVKDRVGASPSVRRVACTTTKRTCIH
jgi:hypothetical protein